MITSIILNSIGIFLLLLIINIFIVCIFELPIRMIIKSYMNKNLINEFKTNSNFNSAGLYSQTVCAWRGDYQAQEPCWGTELQNPPGDGGETSAGTRVHRWECPDP